MAKERSGCQAARKESNNDCPAEGFVHDGRKRKFDTIVGYNFLIHSSLSTPDAS